MRAEIYWIRDVAPGRLAIMPRPRGGDWLADELQSLHDQGVERLVSLLTSDEVEELELGDEGRLAADCGIAFVSFPIADRTVPQFSPATNEFLSELHDHFNAGTAIAVHCRMGIGRSSLVAATVLSLAGLDPEDAFESIALARGTTVPDTAEQRAWVAQFVGRQV